MFALSTTFSLLTGVAGWYYLFYSRAASRLAGVEGHAISLRRQRLRQVGGFFMLLLAVGIFAGFNTFDPRTQASAFVLCWFAVFLLLLLIVILAMLDLRLTWRLRNRPKVRDANPDHEQLRRS